MSEAVKLKAHAQYDRSEVMRIVQSVIAKMEANAGQTSEAITKELHDLAKTIETMRIGMADARAHEVSSLHVPSATDELDAVVVATSVATDAIMTSCEAMQAKVAGRGDDVETVINDEVTKIFEACSFQDITGQRIAKVVSALKEIEGKVSRLLQLLGIEDGAGLKPLADTRSEEEKLKNGPQLPVNAISQDDIDKLLASFD